MRKNQAKEKQFKHNNVFSFLSVMEEMYLF